MVAARSRLGARFRWGGLPGAGLRSEADLRDALRARTMVGRLRAIRAAADRFTVMTDAPEVIREFVDDRTAGFFVDPPYTVGGRGPGTRLYRYHEVDHDGLLAALAKVRGRVVATTDAF